MTGVQTCALPIYAGDAGPRCDPAKPFGTPQLVAGVNSGSYDSTFTPVPGELVAYFYSMRAGTYDLFIATRPDLASAWSVSPITDLNTASTDKEPAPLADNSGLAFASNRPPADAGGDLYFATNDGTTYTLVGPISNLNTTMIDYHPYFQPGTSTLWFASNRTGLLAIYTSTYQGGGSFSAPVQMSDLDVAGYDTEVAIPSPDGLVMYFRSNRPGSLGGIDIWVATRASTSMPWGNARPVDEINSTVLDTPNWISGDLCTIYLSSSRTDASDIFVATRSP